MIKTAANMKISRYLPMLLLLPLLMLLWGGTAQALDLNKAVRIGMGRIVVIEFTDPDCPYCMKAEDYFRNKPEVTRYIFFYPLSMHRGAKAKVQYILSAQNKVKAYQELTAGPLSEAKQAQITPEGIQLQKEHMEMAKENQVTGTPTFIINGKKVEGLNLRKLDQLIDRAR